MNPKGQCKQCGRPFDRRKNAVPDPVNDIGFCRADCMDFFRQMMAWELRHAAKEMIGG